MLTAFAIINMNGRLYDPVIGRMLSPDNYIQMPDYTQNFNRYSYVVNNPLKYTDPSGEIMWGIAIPCIIVGAYIGGVATNQGQLNPLQWNWSGAGAWKTYAGIIGGGLVGLAGGSYLAGGGMTLAYGISTPTGGSYLVGSSSNWNFQWETVAGGRGSIEISSNSKVSGSKNIMIILADSPRFGELINRTELNESEWDYIITDSFSSADEHISSSYASYHKFNNAVIRTHGGAIYGGFMDAAPNDFQKVFIRQGDFNFPGSTYRKYSEALSLLSISSYFNSSTNLVLASCIVGFDTDYMKFLQIQLGNVNLYAVSGSAYLFTNTLGADNPNGIRKVRWGRNLMDGTIINFKTFKILSTVEITNNGFLYY